MSARWTCVALAALGVALSGCSSTSTCNRDADSTTVTSDQRGDNTWFSGSYQQPGGAIIGQPYAYFPPARTITFVHELGSLPDPVISLAFYENGSIAPTAGNQAIVECMDDDVIQIKNDTCSDFYIWVQLRGTGVHAAKKCPGVTLPDDGAAGAAGAQP